MYHVSCIRTTDSLSQVEGRLRGMAIVFVRCKAMVTSMPAKINRMSIAVNLICLTYARIR